MRYSADTINDDELDRLYARLEQAEAILVRVREYADWHASHCEDWCFDHAPKLLQILGVEEASVS